MRMPRLAMPWQSTADYRRYLFAQVDKTQRMGGAICGTRVTHLVGLLVRADDRPPKGRAALCIGCRNTHELGVLHAAGFEPVRGIDLVSQMPGITAMDMHQMSYADEMFDVLFSCHSLEHAYDVDVALKEWARVTVPRGTWAIEVPCRFETTEVDRWDCGGIEGLKAACLPYMAEVLFEQEQGGVARLIGRVK